ncbi:MAG TPA: hypothetical protein VGE97_06595 [Nitrososphaera sp.]|jgi:hypothetical protein
MLKIASFDPGITTGFSLAILDGATLFLACDEEKLSHRNLFDLLEEYAPQHVVCESFEYRNTRHRDNLELFSLELIGVIKLFDPNVNLQNAAKGKGFYNDQKLKSMGLYVPGRNHGRDALRHLLHWWTFGPGYKYNVKGNVMLAQTETVLLKGDQDGVGQQVR